MKDPVYDVAWANHRRKTVKGFVRTSVLFALSKNNWEEYKAIFPLTSGKNFSKFIEDITDEIERNITLYESCGNSFNLKEAELLREP